MNERPIIFSTEMVRAILDGRKTQTRRVIKNMPQQPVDAYFDAYNKSEFWNWWTKDNKCCLPQLKCPYGKVGDLLWVRETFSYSFESNKLLYKSDSDTDGTVPYLLDGAGGFGGGVGNARVKKWKPSIHMPRKASRITLRITNIRVEQVQEITEADAQEEGVEFHGGYWLGGIHKVKGTLKCWPSPIDAYKAIWDSINDKRGDGWGKNPWVWVIEFERVDP